MTDDAKKIAARKRKAKERERNKALGIKKTEVKLSERERAMLDELCEVRGGVRGAYSADEFISTLIRRDHALMKSQVASLGKCAHCNKALPAGCSGAFKGQSECFHFKDFKILSL